MTPTNVYDDLQTLTMIRRELERTASRAGLSPDAVAIRAAVHYLINRAIDEDEALLAVPVEADPDD